LFLVEKWCAINYINNNRIVYSIQFSGARK